MITSQRPQDKTMICHDLPGVQAVPKYPVVKRPAIILSPTAKTT
jgi:hypothetical protein